MISSCTTRELESRAISDETQSFPTAQQPPSDPARPAGWVLGGRYRILDRIGSGGMAEVFRARDDVLERTVAVKVFRAQHVAADTAHGLERQQAEVAALARLNHPNLITLYDGSIGGDAGHAYLVMELIDGPSLASRIADGPLPEQVVREIGIQLSDGLAYVHANGMVHRDVKPENILLGVDRSDDDSTVRARLSDFGIVRLLGSERLTSANFTLGTASYLAPEQARGSDVNPPADVYSLGLVLIEALTGRRSFDGPPLEAAVARLTQRPQIPLGLPEPWPGLLYAMTEFDPALRPSAIQVARTLRGEGSRSLPVAAVAVPLAAGFGSTDASTTQAIASVGAGLPPAAVVPPQHVDDPGSHHRKPVGWIVAAALSLLVILTTLGIFLFSGSSDQSPAQTTPTSTTPSPAADKTHQRTHSSAPATKQVSSSHSAPTKSPSSSASSSAPSSASSSTSSSSSAPKPPPQSNSHSAPAPPPSHSAVAPPPVSHSAPSTSTPASSSAKASSSPAAPGSSAAGSSPGSGG